MRFFLAIFFLSFFLSTGSADLYKVRGTAPNWCHFAADFLEPVGNRPNFTCESPQELRTGKRSLCIRLNNYGCLWQRGASWPGTDIRKGNDGAHDGRGLSNGGSVNNGHSLFTHPKYSIAAKLEWFSRGEPKSALRHAEKYLPWCDTLGSVTMRNGYYRSCRLKTADRVSGRRYCEKPQSGLPSAEQCAACNCPSELAGRWVSGTRYSIHDPLPLFDQNGEPNELMLNIALRNSVNELGGYRPNDQVISLGIEAFMELYVNSR